ncbi:Hint domain-containing protein [Roseinatronobacter sp. NSM]|uniref:Hint domain-containing protein n=1 Tax=Roseinatronobacter sp. NSM TaxID=3457785 RepID=UPI0040370CE8
MFESTVTLAPALRRKPADPLRGSQIAPAGLAAGTLLRTISGPRRIETLMAGDLLLDVDDQIVEIRSVRKVRGRKDDLIEVNPSALGLGVQPIAAGRALVVGRGQKLAIHDWRSHVVFGKPLLSVAQALVDGVHVRSELAADAELCTLSFDTPTVIQANGILALVSP